jgi:soluble lytic murein transglycosylase-like protein
MDYRELAIRIAAEEGVDPDLFLRLIQAESSFNKDVVSSAGAIGLGQLMPATAKELGVDPHDPEQNLRGSARYLRQQINTFGDIPTALAAYNAGPGAVRRHGGIPPFQETQKYVSRILGSGAFPVAAAPSQGARAEQGGIASTAQQPQAPQQPQWMKTAEMFGRLGTPKASQMPTYDPYEIIGRFAQR